MNYYIGKYRELLKKHSLDAILIYANTYSDRHLKAATGTYSVLQNYVLITKNSAHVTETRYLQLDIQRRTSLPILPTEGEHYGIEEIIKVLGLKKNIGIIGDAKYKDIHRLKPTKVVELSKESDEIIRYKSDEYIQEMKKHARFHANIMENIRFKKGDNQLTHATKIQKEVIQNQYSLSFPTCITSGNDLKTTTTVIAHNKKIAKSDVICIDMGTKQGIYTTDMTRMYFVNNKQAKALFTEIKKVHDSIIQSFVSSHKTFRDVINEYKRAFKGSTVVSDVLEEDFGHGIGFALHEYPIIEKDDGVIGKNIIFTLEPTFVTPFGKMRIEDMIAISSSGTVTNLTGGGE